MLYLPMCGADGLYFRLDLEVRLMTLMINLVISFLLRLPHI